MRGVLAEAVPGDDLRRRPAEPAPGAIRGVAGGHHRRLRIHRLVDGLGRTLVEQTHEVRPQRYLRFLPDSFNLGKAGVGLEHAHGLRALSREDHRQLHSVTIDEPQVKPPPTPCSSTRWPRRILPARTN